MSEMVFHLSRAFQGVGLVLMLLVGGIYLWLLPGLVAQRVERSFGLLLILFTLPFFLLGAYFFVRHSGTVILREDAIVRQRFGQETVLPYEAISAVRPTDSQIPAGFTLLAGERSLSFSREIEDFPRLYETLRERTRAVRDMTEVDFPWEVSVSPAFYWDLLLGVVVIFVIVGGGTLYLVRRNVESNPAQVAAAMLGGGLVLLFLYVGASIPEIQEKPHRMIFGPEQIEIRPLVGEPRLIDTSRIQAITLEEERRSVRAFQLWQRIEYVEHPVILTLEGGERLVIQESQAWAYGYSPEQFLDALRRLYG